MSLLLFFGTATDTPLPIIDIILGLLLALGLIRGLIKGFIVELTSLLAFILGVYGAIHFSYFIIDLLSQYVSWPANYINIAAFIFTFILIVIGISLLGRLITKLANLVALGLLNRLLGGVFGFLKTAFLLSIFLMFFTDFNANSLMVKSETLESSVLFTPIEEFGEKILPSVLEKIRNHHSWRETFSL